MTDSIITHAGKTIIMNRAYKTVPDYTVPSKFKIGINSEEPLITDIALTETIPIYNGTVIDAGASSLTGVDGGDTTTSNTDIYKIGAGVTDNTGQNLLANATDVNKIWYKSGLSFTGSQPFGLWIYFDTQTTIDKITEVRLKIRTNANALDRYYMKLFLTTDLVVGWNWLHTGTTIITALPIGAGGSPTSFLNELRIEIITINATDTFLADEVVYDLCRQWVTTDLEKNFVTGYPTFDETNNIVTIRCFLSSVEANGFMVDSVGLFNTDTINKLTDIDRFQDESKSDTDEFTFIIKNQVV